MKKIAILFSLPILVFTLSNFKPIPKEPIDSTISCGGAMVTFAGKRSGEIDLALAQKTTELFARYPKDGKILSFEMILVKGEKSEKFSAKGNQLTSNMKMLLKKMKKGNSIKFTNIKVEWREGKSMPAPTISLKLI